MKKIVPLALSVFLLVFLGFQLIPAALQKFTGLEQQHPLFETVTPQEAKNLIESRKDLLLIDVRGQDELGQGYIEGSTLMPLWDIIQGTRRPSQNKPILLICAVGGRFPGTGPAHVKKRLERGL